MTAERFYDTFGTGNAGSDLARADGHFDDFFVHTDLIRHFLSRSPSFPFVVGPKGAGKSLLLFKKLIQAREVSGAVVLPAPPQRAFTPAFDFAEAAATWSSFWQLSRNGKPEPQAWGSIWEWALLRTILSAWLVHERRSPTERLPELERLTEGLVRADPYDLISQYLQLLGGGQQELHGRRVLPNARPLREFMVDHCHDFPPIYLFLDNHDEVFEAQPDFWKASSYGAFLAIQSLHERSNRRLHCFLTLRSDVICELQKSECFSQWRPDLFTITWTDDKLIELFGLRAARLRHEHLASPELVDTAPLTALFGKDLVPPAADRPVLSNLCGDEDASAYVLRHTLRRPRDLIIVGNEIVQFSWNGEDRSNATRVRAAVESAAQIIGQAYLSEVRNRWPWGTEGQASIAHFIGKYLHKNVLARADVAEIERQFASALGAPAGTVHPFQELASLGLIGYTVGDANGGLVQRFLMPGETSSAPIPETAQWLLVHPVLYGAPFHIAVTPGIIVGPHRRFELPARSITDVPPPSPDLRLSFGLLEDVDVATGPIRIPPVPATPTDAFAYTWIHVSDIHFGAGRAAHRFDQRDVMEAIRRDVRENAPKRPDAIFVTGDIAFSASPRQYVDAERWLGELADVAGVSRSAIRLVPGNHDVDRTQADRVGVADAHQSLRADPDKLDDYLADENEWERLVRKLSEFRNLVNRFPEHPAAENGLDWCELLAPVPGRRGPIRVVGLSTVWVSDKADGRVGPALEHFSSNLLLSRGQLSRAFGAAEKTELVLLLSHHPPEWLHERCRTWLEEQLSRLHHVHLCGHVHRAKTRVTTAHGRDGQAVRYVAGAAHGDPGDERCHGYAWGAVSFDPKRRRWCSGWAPRTYVEGVMRADRLRYDLDDAGFAWHPLDLAWSDPKEIVASSR